jgi:flavodoxin
MKTVVVYYSLDGNCAFIAKEIKARLGADLIRLQTKDEKQRNGFAKYFWGGGMVVLGKKPELKPYDFNPEAYDLIVIGVPVWAGSPAPPIRTFLSKTKITGKKIALYVCHGGGQGKAMEKLKALLPDNDIAAETGFLLPLKNIEEAKQQAADWVKGLE